MSNGNQRNSTDRTRNLLQIISKQKNGLRICHLNAQSLKNKIDEFRNIFNGSLIDIICVSETWLVPELNNDLFSVNGYKLLRNDRITHGGGVAIYVRDCYKCKVVCKSNSNDVLEFLLISVEIEDTNILVGCVYRPYKNISLETFYDKFKDISALFTNIIVTGDFNSNVLVENTVVNDMLSYGLHLVNTQNPTHFTNTSSTLLDLFFSAQENKVLLFDQISAPSFSRHDLIIMIYDLKCNSSGKSLTFRDFKNIDSELLISCANLIDWDQIYFLNSIDDKVDFLQNCLNDLFECLVPVKKVNIKGKQNPWFTGEIHRHITERNKIYNHWKRYRLPQDYDKYRMIKKKVSKMIRLAKIKHYEEKFSTALNTKQTWKCIKNIGIGGKNLNKTVSEDLNELNRRFACISNCDNLTSQVENCQNCDMSSNTVINSCDIVDNSSLSSLGDGQLDENKFNFRNVFGDEVYRSIMSIKSNATGLDNINPIFLKKLLHIILPHITHIFNTILTTSVFPKSWKKVKITPIPKSNTEYRPIAILPVLSKALEKLMASQMSEFLVKQNLLSDKQSGFRPKRSCVTALISVCEDIRKSLDNNEIIILLLLDFSKAFDNVNHRQLLKKLRRYFKFSNSAIKLIGSYLQGRLQTVCSGNSFSGFIELTKGVPQGSVLGPLLFAIYINDLPNVVRGCNLHMYADDVQVYKSCNAQTITQCAIELNEELSAISRWSSENSLSLNPSKSKYLVISRKPVRCNNLRLMINNAEIELVDKATNLGIVINNKLSYNDHINLIVGRVYGMLRCLWATQYYTPRRIKLLLAKTYLIPKLLYGCELFSNLDSVCMRKINVLFNNITRYVFGLKRCDSVSMYSRQIFGVPLKSLLDSRSLILMHKIIYTEEPAYLYSQIRFLRSSRCKNIVQFRYNYLLSERQFFIYTTRLWNSLPNYLTNIRNAQKFKKTLLLHFQSTTA